MSKRQCKKQDLALENIRQGADTASKLRAVMGYINIQPAQSLMRELKKKGLIEPCGFVTKKVLHGNSPTQSKRIVYKVRE